MKMNNKVKAYVALAASFAALEVNSQVVCVTPNVGPFTATGADDPKVSVELDIDGDGTNDFQIMEAGFSASSSFGGGGYIGGRARIGIGGLNGAGILASSTVGTVGPIVLSYSQTINSLAGNFYLATSFQSTNQYYVGFRLGNSVNEYYFTAGGYTDTSGGNNLLNGGAPAYIGIEFDAGNDATTNYGWIEVQATALGPHGTGTSPAAAMQVDILSYGYE